MKTYLVGGAVRDRLMGNEPKDLDYVVVGSTPTEMLALGFKQVGADFPVFLHPDTGDEYALARIERKNGSGYNGFDVEFGTDVTLEDDLRRRDLTINAMAMDSDGNLVDPFNGAKDLKDKKFRHVDPDGFKEDPLRVLRWARFRARFPLDWHTDPSTRALMTSMVEEGMLKDLTRERVMKEMDRAVMEPYPEMFFNGLREIGGLLDVFPELDALWEALENPKWHPEGNAFKHTMLVLRQAVNSGADLEGRYMALVHDLGKGLTPKADLPKHHGHDVSGAKLVQTMAHKYLWSKQFANRLSLVTRFHMNGHRLDKLNAKTYVKMFDAMGATHSDDLTKRLMNLFKWDSRGRLGSEKDDVTFADKLLVAFEGYRTVKYSDLFGPDDKPSSEKVKQTLYNARRKAVSTSLQEKA